VIEERLVGLLREALVASAGELGIEGALPEIELSRPRQREHGDFATNVALVLAKRAGRAPRDHRPERRRQEHTVQSDRRRASADRWPRLFRRTRHHRPLRRRAG